MDRPWGGVAGPRRVGLYDVHPPLPRRGCYLPQFDDSDGIACRWAGYIHPDAERNPVSGSDLPESFRDANAEPHSNPYGNFYADRHCDTNGHPDSNADRDAYSHYDAYPAPNVHIASMESADTRSLSTAEL